MKALYLMNPKTGYNRSVPEFLINMIQDIPGLELTIDTDWDPDAPDQEE